MAFPLFVPNIAGGFGWDLIPASDQVKFRIKQADGTVLQEICTHTWDGDNLETILRKGTQVEGFGVKRNSTLDPQVWDSEGGAEPINP